MANAKDRKSNFELLRIVAMMAIIGSHYFSHGAGFGPSVASRILFHTCLLTSGNTGVAIFLLITGWFVRDAHFSLGKWLRLVGETWFYSWIGLLIALFVNRSKVDMLNVLTALFPISSAQNWYAGNFIILYLFMPFITKTAVYLNSSIEEYNKLMAFSVFSFVLLGFVTPFNKVVSNFVWMLFCVLWGNYLRLFTEKRSITVKQCLSFLLIIELVITFYSLTVDYLYNTYKLSFIDQMRDHLMGRFSVCTLTAASLIVILFSRLCFFQRQLILLREPYLEYI